MHTLLHRAEAAEELENRQANSSRAMSEPGGSIGFLGFWFPWWLWSIHGTRNRGQMNTSWDFVFPSNRLCTQNDLGPLSRLASPKEFPTVAWLDAQLLLCLPNLMPLRLAWENPPRLSLVICCVWHPLKIGPTNQKWFHLRFPAVWVTGSPPLLWDIWL